MSEVHKPHRTLFIAGDQTIGEAAKHLLGSTHAERVAGRAHKKALAPREKGLAVVTPFVALESQTVDIIQADQIHLHHELHERIDCPIVLHICGNTADRLGYIRAIGLECFHFDSKVAAAQARALAGEKLSLMGGTSNFTVVRNGTAPGIAQEVQEKLAIGIDIIGPECAVPLDAPWANLRSIADEAKRQSKRLPDSKPAT